MGSDHPHACGENPIQCLLKSIHYGPSPRVWGEQHLSHEGMRIERTIPTRVGRTLITVEQKLRELDHPHACGENIFAAEILSRACGPSPRVWGEPLSSSVARAHSRTIPTRVGRTVAVGEHNTPPPDHPHACGENSI